MKIAVEARSHAWCGLFSKSLYPVIAGDEFIAQRDPFANEEGGDL
jgi:hypothetical protein